MKKLIIFTSLFIVSIYLSLAVDIVLNSWQKLDNSSWDNLSSVLNKVDINSSNLNINWKLAVDWKICDNNDNCLGECSGSNVWDIKTNTCVLPATTPETSWLTCKDIYDNKNVRTSWLYYIKPSWYSWEAFQVYCDMTHEGWWWTLFAKNKEHNWGLPVKRNPLNVNQYWVLQNDKWVAVRDSMTTWMMFFNNHNQFATMSKSNLLTKWNCVSLTDVSDLSSTPNWHLFHYEIHWCTGSWEDYTIFNLHWGTRWAHITAMTSVTFDKNFTRKWIEYYLYYIK